MKSHYLKFQNEFLFIFKHFDTWYAAEEIIGVLICASKRIIFRDAVALPG